MSNPTELEAANRAIDIWNEFGKPLGLTVAGWSYYDTATFVDSEKIYVYADINTLKSIRKHVTKEDFFFPKSYYAGVS